MSAHVVAAATPAAIVESMTVRRAAFWGLLAAKTLGGWGVQWDIRWHLLIGRDSFWIPPHIMTYASVTLSGLIAFAEPIAGGRRVAGLVGTPGFHLAWWGVVVTVLAAPIDDLWHRLFGIDVTLWSPPHLLGMVGAQLNTLGCMRIALETWPGRHAWQRGAVLLAGTMLLGAFAIWVDPGVQTAYRHGGAFFFTWAMLGALAFVFVHVLTTRLTGLRSAPLLLALAAFALNALGLAVSDVGFAITQPTSALEAAIAADPDSPIAVAYEMARRNGTVPGRSMALRWLPLAPAVLMALVDARRRWAAAALAFGLGLILVSGVHFARLPALSHAVPGVADVLLAVLVTALAALAGSAVAVRVADRLTPARLA
jgi:hypothetical protein